MLPPLADDNVEADGAKVRVLEVLERGVGAAQHTADFKRTLASLDAAVTRVDHIRVSRSQHCRRARRACGRWNISTLLPSIISRAHTRTSGRLVVPGRVSIGTGAEGVAGEGEVAGAFVGVGARAELVLAREEELERASLARSGFGNVEVEDRALFSC